MGPFVTASSFRAFTFCVSPVDALFSRARGHEFDIVVVAMHHDQGTSSSASPDS
jgi:hypothetical protein